MNSAAATAATLACILGASGARAEDAICKAVFDAGERTMQPPNHQYVTQTAGSFGIKGSRSESTHTGDASFVLVDGQWHRSPLNIKAMLEREQENRRNTKHEHCAHIRDEAADGEAAGAYSTHYENEFAKVDALIWICRNSGLTLREELDMDPGDVGKSHTSVRTSYSGVAAPAGAK
jgi:hypothetical protein